MRDPSSKDPDPAASGPASFSLHAVVRGRVQGVGFRYFVAREARRLGLAGSVRNLADGRVEVFAKGHEPALRELERLLRQGPAFSRVEQVEVEWGVPVTPSSEFIIGF